MTDILDDHGRREQERARRQAMRQTAPKDASKGARPVRTPRRSKTAQRAQASPSQVDVTGEMPRVSSTRRVQHEGLIAWIVRMLMRLPTAIGAIATGFVHEVGDVLASVLRPLRAIVPTRPHRGATAPTIIDIEQDGLGDAFGDAVAGLRRRRDAAPVVLTPAQQRARDRRRALTRRRIRGGVAIAIAVVAVLGWRIVPSSDAFRIRHMEILGASSVGDLEVRMRVDDLVRDQTIYTVDTDEMRAKVAALPFVRSVDVDRHFPGGLTIRVVEHRPLALGYDTAQNSWWLIAPDGRVLAKGSEEEWRDRIPLVRLDATKVKPGMRLEDEPAVELLRARASDSTLAISSIEVTPSSVTATIQDDVQIRFGRPRQLRTKLAAAERMLQIGRDKGWKLAYIDVAVPANPVPCQLGRPCATMPAPDQLDAADAADAATVTGTGSATASTDTTTGATASDADDAAAADDGAVTSTAPRPEQGPSPTTAATVLANAAAQSSEDDEAPRDGFETATRRDEMDAAATP